MDIVKKVTKKFGKIPTAISYKDLCEVLGKKFESVFAIENEVLDSLEALAKASPRRRILILLHDHLDETAHRMINIMTKGTYALPHKHTDPNTSEEFTALRGSACVLEFSEEGEVIGSFPFGEGHETNLVEIKSGSIHTVVPLTEICTLFEVKGQTKYDPTLDKSFYPWAPKEDSDPKKVSEYLDKLYSNLTFKGS